MGSVLVNTMAQDAAAEASGKRLHPFFSKDPVSLGTAVETAVETSPSPCLDEPSSSTGTDVIQPTSHPTNLEPNAKRQKLEDVSDQSEPEARSRRGRRRKNVDPLANSLLHHFRKPGGSLQAGASTDGDAATSLPVTNRAEETGPEDAAGSTTPPRPRKILKFNLETGTLGSPPKPMPPLQPTKVVVIRYGKDDASRKLLGGRITNILEGKCQPLEAAQPKKRRPRASRTNAASANPTDSSKATHPLFTDEKTNGHSEKSASSKPIPAPVKQKQSIFMSTPVSPRKPKPLPQDLNKMPQFGFKVKGTKIPGSMYPMWPPKGFSHVRGLDERTTLPKTAKPLSIRKSKGQVTVVRDDESIMSRLTKRLRPDEVKRTMSQNPDAFSPVPPGLRLPQRHFESGIQIRARVAPQLHGRASLASSNDMDELMDDEDSLRAHPALIRLYQSLSSSLSAYDRSTCENCAWTQKYAPATSDHVLQAGKESFLLRDWVQALRVQSVDTGTSEPKSIEMPKKKRKKHRLDDFIVDSDEEEEELDEVSEDDEDWAAAGQGQAKSIVRRGGTKVKDQGRLPNAMVISGPHGSGKTAAVFAVAKELDFEIFEINASSRRSGKDLLERIGDMTRNHLVQQHRAGRAEDDETKMDPTADEVKSGKQGMMTAFFKPKPGSQEQPKSQSVRKPKPADSTMQGQKSGTSKDQKQSLILLEEVDVLYEEDKQFWATLIGLIVQSRRPFIMTCNDESLVPLQGLPLYGILRFSPPPTSLAVDLCLLVAANEGHLLKRDGVEMLYRSRGRDLRATITELNYWCQIGIGDRRGGFDWFVSRWPLGTDRDEHGRVVRVASEDTYRAGMGWLGRDPIAGICDIGDLDKEEEVLHQVRDLWRVDVADWCETSPLYHWAECQEEIRTSHGASSSSMLAAYEVFASSMSDANCCLGGLPDDLHEELDPTLPGLSSKARDDYTIGSSLLEADPIHRQASCSAGISLFIKSRARHCLWETTRQETQHPCDELAPLTETRAVAQLNATFDKTDRHLVRRDISLAFDPIAVSPSTKSAALTPSHLDPSVFDRTLRLIVLDVAPWVRGIVAYDHRLQAERVKLSNLLSEGGGGGGNSTNNSSGGSGKRKRMRNTRAAYSALEGGERRHTRREKYFGDELVMGFVMRTAGNGWQDALIEEAESVETSVSQDGTPSNSQGGVVAV